MDLHRFSNGRTESRARPACHVEEISALQILHMLSGRLRVHLPFWSGRSPHLIEQRLNQHPGICRAEANPITCNVLILFDPHLICNQRVLAALRTAAQDVSMSGDNSSRHWPAVEKNGRTSPWSASAVRGLNIGADRACGSRISQAGVRELLVFLRDQLRERLGADVAVAVLIAVAIVLLIWAHSRFGLILLGVDALVLLAEVMGEPSPAKQIASA